MSYVILALLLSLAATPDTSEIEFGSGGGFSGAITTYVLNDKGELFKLNAFRQERELLKKIDLGLTKSFFQRIKDEGFLDLKVNKPGNTYKFLKLRLDGTSHDLVWVGKSENKNLNLFYTDLQALRL